MRHPETTKIKKVTLELHNDIKTFHAKTHKEWRKWLEKKHKAEKSLWLIIYHKNSDTQSVHYDEAVEEAICFGWIDSKAHKRDDESKYQFFTQRKSRSNWSKANRERAEKMIKQKQMTPSGQSLVDLAKKTGTWDVLIDVQNSVIPADLQKLFDKNKTAFKNFDSFPSSSKRIILEWILNAKRPETRLLRITQTVELAAKNIKANHYRQ